MPTQSLKLIPGVDQNKTEALNEAAISETQLVRFIPDRNGFGLVQKLGGWTKWFTTQISSTIRNLWAWDDTNSNSWLAVGAETSLSVITSGSRRDITPQTNTSDVAVDLITTAASAVVVIEDSSSPSADSFDSVYVKTQISVGGVVLFGLYRCTGISATQYSIISRNILLEANPATFTNIKTVTGATGTGTEATITFAGTDVIPVGTILQVAGMNPAGYDTIGTVVVSASSAGSVTYAETESGAFVAGGTVTFPGNVPLFDTTSGSSLVEILLPNHGYFEGGTFPIIVPVTVGGITLSGNYIINSVVDAYNFTINAQNSATSTDSEYMNGGDASYEYYIGVGPSVPNAGYGVGGYGTGGYGSGITPPTAGGTPIAADDWTLDNFGENLIATPLDGPIYAWSPTSGDEIASIITEGPPINSGSFVAMPQRQIISWGSTVNGVQDPLLIRWCEVNNYNVWSAAITNQAGSYRLPKGSKLVQGIQGPQQGLIWTDLGVWAMQYVGPPYVYQFTELGSGCGLIGRRAAGAMNGVVYWMGQSQFFRLAGQGPEPIRCPVWDVIFQDLDTTNLNKIRIAPNSRFGEITWYYPTNSNGGEVSHYVKYNVFLNEWDYGTLGRTAWINESVLGAPIGAGTNNYIYQHETSPDADGQPMVSYFQTGYFALSDANLKMFVDQVWPDMKWGYFGGVQNATVRLTFYVADYPGQTPLTYGPFSLIQSTTFITPRFRGRLVSIRIDSNDIGSWWRLGNFRYRVQEDGKF